MSGRVGCREGGWAISPERNYFCPKNKKSVHFDAVFNRQKTWTVTRSLWDTDFAVQLRNKAYRNSAKISKNHGQIRRGGGAVAPQTAQSLLSNLKQVSTKYTVSSKAKPDNLLSRVSTLTHDIDIAILSVRLSVRHVPVFYGNGLTY